MTKTPFVIRNDLELVAALNRAEELAGCADGSAEALELGTIAHAVVVYTESMRVLRMVDANPHKTDPLASKD